MRLGKTTLSMSSLDEAPIASEQLDPRRWNRTTRDTLRLDLETESIEVGHELSPPPEYQAPNHETSGRVALRALALGPAPRVGNPMFRLLNTAPAGSSMGAKSTRVSVPVPEPSPGRVSELRLHRVAAPAPPPSTTTLFDLRVRAATAEAEGRLDRRLYTSGHSVRAGSYLLLESLGPTLPSNRLRIAVDGDQDLRVIEVDRHDRPIRDRSLAPGPQSDMLSRGTRRVLVIGYGQPDATRRAPNGAGFAYNTPLLRLGHRGFAVPGAVLNLNDVAGREAIQSPEELPRLASALELHLPDLITIVVMVLARTGDTPGAAPSGSKRAASLHARGAELAPPTIIERGDELVWISQVLPPGSDLPRPRPMSLTAAPGPGWWVRGLIGRRDSVPMVVSAIRSGTFNPLEDPRSSDVGHSTVRLERA